MNENSVELNTIFEKFTYMNYVLGHAKKIKFKKNIVFTGNIYINNSNTVQSPALLIKYT